MKKLLLVITLLLFVPSVYAAESIGKVLAIKGEVKALNADGSLRSVLKLYSPVYENEKIVSSKGAKMQIVFNDKSLFTISENTEVILDKYAYNPKTHEGRSILEVTKGIFKFITGKIAKKDHSKVKVNTPFATIGVRGSGGIVNVSPSGQTTLNMTLCCINIKARGSNLSPVELTKVNTFSTVDSSGNVTKPKDAPISMLVELNNAISLESAKKAKELKKEDPNDSAKKVKRKSLKSLVKAKKEVKKARLTENNNVEDTASANNTSQDEVSNDVDANNSEGEGTVVASSDEGDNKGKRKPLVTSFLKEFGSGNLSSSNNDSASLNDKPAIETSDAQQQEQSRDALNEGSADISIFGKKLAGNWQQRKSNLLVDGGNVETVINKDNNKIIFKRLKADGTVNETVAFDAPNKGKVKSITSADFGNIYLYRGLHDNFVYAASDRGSLNNYEFITGDSTKVTAYNQNVAGQRLFFKFIPDNNKGIGQFANFNVASGVNGFVADNNLGMVIDHTADNNQFLAGNVKFGAVSSFKFMAGDTLTSGAQLLDGDSYSFTNSANGPVFVNTNLSSNKAFGDINNAGNAVVDAYELNIGSDKVYAVASDVQTPVNNNPSSLQTLQGYSAGYITKDINAVNGSKTVIRVANNAMSDIAMTRSDTASGGVTLNSNFTYSALTSTGAPLLTSPNTLNAQFGSGAVDKAYIDHNTYGAEANNATAGITFLNSSAGVNSIDGAMISSNFVDIPTNLGIEEDCKNCAFLTWGVWAGNINFSNSEIATAQLIPYVVGDTNKVKTWGQLNANGVTSPNVSYKGILVGATTNNAGTVDSKLGSYDAGVDFANRKIGFSGKFGDYTFGSTTKVSTGSVLSQAGFDNVAIDNLKLNGNAVNGNANISGAFYGNSAENMGGNFNFNDNTNTVNGAGIFAGKKQ